MKTYLLKTPAIVEPKARLKRSTARQGPAPTSLADVSSRDSQPRVLFIGLDVHTDTIAVSVAPSDSTEVRRYGLIGGTHAVKNIWRNRPRRTSAKNWSRRTPREPKRQPPSH